MSHIVKPRGRMRFWRVVVISGFHNLFWFGCMSFLVFRGIKWDYESAKAESVFSIERVLQPLRDDEPNKEARADFKISPFPMSIQA